MPTSTAGQSKLSTGPEISVLIGRSSCGPAQAGAASTAKTASAAKTAAIAWTKVARSAPATPTDLNRAKTSPIKDIAGNVARPMVTVNLTAKFEVEIYM